MATIAAMAMLKPRCMNLSSPNNPSIKQAATVKPTSFFSLQNLPKGLAISKVSISSSPLTTGAIAGAIFSALSQTDAAFAAQQIADIAEGDSRGTALLLPIIPAIAWVLYNILQPALNQLNRMRSERGFIVGIGLGSGFAAAAGLMSAPSASAAAAAGEMAAIAEAAASDDKRGLLLLIVVTPAIAWVLFNILQPALNQINKMRSS